MNLRKTEQMSILRELLIIGDLLYKSEIILGDGNLPGPVFTDDKERYLKMAIRIDPTDKFILYRKKNINHFLRNNERQKFLIKTV